MKVSFAQPNYWAYCTEVFNSYWWNAFCNWHPFLPSSFIMLVGFVGGILTRHPTDSVSLLSRSPSFTVIIWATCLVRRLKLLILNRSCVATSSIIDAFACMWSKVWKPRRTKSSDLQQPFPHLLSLSGVVSFLIFSNTLNFRDASPMQHCLSCLAMYS